MEIQNAGSKATMATAKASRLVDNDEQVTLWQIIATIKRNDELSGPDRAREESYKLPRT